MSSPISFRPAIPSFSAAKKSDGSGQPKKLSRRQKRLQAAKDKAGKGPEIKKPVAPPASAGSPQAATTGVKPPIPPVTPPKVLSGGSSEPAQWHPFSVAGYEGMMQQMPTSYGFTWALPTYIPVRGNNKPLKPDVKGWHKIGLDVDGQDAIGYVPRSRWFFDDYTEGLGTGEVPENYTELMRSGALPLQLARHTLKTFPGGVETVIHGASNNSATLSRAMSLAAMKLSQGSFQTEAEGQAALSGHVKGLEALYPHRSIELDTEIVDTYKDGLVQLGPIDLRNLLVSGMAHPKDLSDIDRRILQQHKLLTPDVLSLNAANLSAPNIATTSAFLSGKPTLGKLVRLPEAFQEYVNGNYQAGDAVRDANTLPPARRVLLSDNMTRYLGLSDLKSYLAGLKRALLPGSVLTVGTSDFNAPHQKGFLQDWLKQNTTPIPTKEVSHVELKMADRPVKGFQPIAFTMK